MKLSSLHELFERAARITGVLQEKTGPGTSWQYIFPDGTTTTYEITNVKTPGELKDQFAHLAITTWSIKDHLKHLADRFGTTPAEIELFVADDSALPMCADLANLLKHGVLTKSRSGQWPVIGDPTYTLSVTPATVAARIKSILFTPEGIKLDIADPESVEISFEVTSQSGASLGDGLEFLRAGIASWEALLRRLGPAA